MVAPDTGRSTSSGPAWLPLVSLVSPVAEPPVVGAGRTIAIPCGSVASGDPAPGRPRGRSTAVPASSSTVNARDGTSTNASGQVPVPVPVPEGAAGGPTR